MNSFHDFFDKLKKVNYLALALELTLVFVFIFSTWQVVLYFKEGKHESDFNDSLVETAVLDVSPELEYDVSEEAILQITPFEGYDPNQSDVLLFPDIKVDFKKLKEKYPKIVGWIYNPGTPINYPVVQGADNTYFVTHMPNGAENSAGSIFMDHRDNADLTTDFVHILYGHNMKNNSMFGTVLDYRKEGYFEEHPFMFYFTEEKTYRLELFAGVNTLGTSHYYDEPAAEKRQSFLTNAISSSTFSSKITVTPEDKIFMLSTCSGATGQLNRYVLLAKIVEI